MAGKRRHGDMEAAEKEASITQPSKRHRASERKRANHLETDPNTGQRFVFGGLEDSTIPSDEDLEFEDESDALAYLRAVRQEAGGIPNLLVAAKAGPQLPAQPSGADLPYDDDVPDRSLYDSGVGDNRGYYQDGGYVAAPDDYAVTATPAAHPIHEAYYASILTRFCSLRTVLQQRPLQSAIDALPSNNAHKVGPLGHKSRTFAVWNSRLARSDPLPVQVAAMERAEAVRLLRILLAGKSLRVGCQVTERTSRWVWSLLARLPDRGDLDYVDVGHVRELGKRAVLMMASIAQVAALRAEVELDEGEDDLEDLLADVEEEAEEGVAGELLSAPRSPAPAEDDVEDGEIGDDEPEANEARSMPATSGTEDMEAARARLLANVGMMESSDAAPEVAAPIDAHDPERAAMNARATLNMILTVAGEFYGQRDLLEFRDPFPGL